MSLYRNHPGGLGGISENLTANMSAVSQEDIIAAGNRSQRRWARKKLTAIHCSQEGGAHVCTYRGESTSKEKS
ncbi:MAG: hypothetical protein D4S02_15400 [Rhodocyclaceae bacterium]|nr:MAG: hypothetical protein D4S02_15400 [Rhodocyclaceae bacterium]